MHRAGKDQLHLFRTAQIDVLADDFLEKAASIDGSVPHLGEGELGLEDGQIVVIQGMVPPDGKRMRVVRGRRTFS